MTVNELRVKRTELWENTKNFLETHRSEKGTLNAEDDVTYNRMANEIDDYGKEIQRLEKLESLDKEFSKAVNTPIKTAPKKNEKEKVMRATDEYVNDFARALRGKALIHNVLTEGSDADGGYLVPIEFENQIVTELNDVNVIRSISKVITTSADKKIPISATHSEAKWINESGAYTESNPTFDQKMIEAFKLTDLVKVSNELLQDNTFGLEQYISNEFVRAFAIAEEKAFCIGTGTNQPTGIFTDNGGSVGVTSASAVSISVDDIISLVYSLKSPYRKQAKFLMNDSTVALLRKLKDQNGVYLWQPSVQSDTPDKLLGYDIYTSPYAPVVTAGTSSVVFGDFSNYWIADRMGRTVQRLNELYSVNGQVGFIATERVDGKVIMPEGIKLLKSAAK